MTALFPRLRGIALLAAVVLPTIACAGAARDTSSARGDSLSLYVTTERGPGPRIVFLPGLGATTRYWRQRVDTLRATHELTFVDLLGFGRSPRPDMTYSVATHVEALDRSLRGSDRFVLVGHSLGAAVALAYAAAHPERVDGLVLVSLPYFGAPGRAAAYFRRAPVPNRWVLRYRWITEATCMIVHRALGPGLPPTLARAMPPDLMEDLNAHSWRSATSSIWDGLFRYDAAVDADRLPPLMPVLLLYGGDDTAIDVDSVAQLGNRHPSWDVRRLAGIDHHPLLRDSVAVLEALEHFLSARPVVPERVRAPRGAP